MRFIDLFCGIGGFHLALAKRGHQCVFASEIDKIAKQDYHSNFGIKPTGDITNVASSDIPPHDILCGGFPCQAFSQAGNQLGFNEARGTLFFDIIRIAKYHQPKFLLLENVKNLQYHDNGKTIATIYSLLDEIGYNTSHQILASNDYNFPQKRERVYITAIRKDLNLYQSAPKKSEEFTTIEDIKELDLPVNNKPTDFFTRNEVIFTTNSRLPEFYQKHQNESLIEFDLTDDSFERYIPGRTNKLIQLGFIKKYIRHRVQGIFYSSMGVCPTLPTMNNRYIYIDGYVRLLSKLEQTRVMGFPDNHIISDKHFYKRLGNAVIPGMVGKVFDAITPNPGPKMLF